MPLVAHISMIKMYIYIRVRFNYLRFAMIVINCNKIVNVECSGRISGQFDKSIVVTVFFYRIIVNTWVSIREIGFTFIMANKHFHIRVYCLIYFPFNYTNDQILNTTNFRSFTNYSSRLSNIYQRFWNMFHISTVKLCTDELSY